MTGSPLRSWASADPIGLSRSGGALDREDLADLGMFLDGALRVFERADRPFSAAEIRMKSMISVLRSEVEAHQQTRSSRGSRGCW
ncbi:MAG TPA: hypothetical protein VEB66_06000 [Opitutaceae bacterium]|nr:hypothetical protein [Opitutaceae bacterium]